MKTLTQLLILISMVHVGSCRDKFIGEPLSIINNSDYRIYYWYSYWKTEDYKNYHYPDTILPIEKPVYLNSIAPHNATGVGEEDPDWGKIFSELSGGKFSVYFFKEPLETQADWDLVRQTYNLYRKDVNYQELVDNHYKITYP